MFTINELKVLGKLLNNESGEELITIKDKINNVLNEVKDYNLCLWRFHWDCGRQGDLEGVFKATKDEVKNAIGCSAYFGEVLGKHSEIYGELEEGDIKLITDDPFKTMNATTSGFDPLEYIDDINYYIDDLTLAQLKAFGEFNDYKIDSNDVDEVMDFLIEKYDGSCAEELWSARNHALKF